MDHLPKWLRTVIHKLDFLALPNLGILICAIGVMAYFAAMSGFSAVENFNFDPMAVRAGEWWRLFAFPFSDPGTLNQHPLFFVFSVLFTYFIFNSIEQQWGAAPLTIFVLISYISTVAGALILERSTNIWYYVLLNVSLVFGTIFPNFEILLFFILPVKAKWMTLFVAALLLFEFIIGSWVTKQFYLFALFPYFLFFGQYFVTEALTKLRIRKNRSRFDKDMWR